MAADLHAPAGLDRLFQDFSDETEDEEEPQPEELAENDGPSSILSNYHTVQDIVFTTLRDEILSGKLKPGEKLNTSRLSRRLGVSRTPIREAISQLISVGLIETVPHQGAFVKKLSFEDLIEIYYIRSALSGLAARLAIPNMTAENLQQLFKLCDQMEQSLAAGDDERYLQLNLEFHSLIYQAARSPRLEKLFLEYHGLSQQYRALGTLLPGRSERANEEHRALAEAIAARDGDRAAWWAQEHHLNTARTIATAIGRPLPV